MKYFCNCCGKEFELSEGQLKIYNSVHTTIFYCGKECRHEVYKQRLRKQYYKYIKNNRDIINECARRTYKRNIEKISERYYSKDLSPNQLGCKDLSSSEKQSMISKLSGAQVKAYRTNKYSNRRGVQLQIKRNKKTGTEYSYWCVEKQINNIKYRKICNSEEEAIAYVEELENKYFDQDQLNIRDKSLKSMNKKEDK